MRAVRAIGDVTTVVFWTFRELEKVGTATKAAGEDLRGGEGDDEGDDEGSSSSVNRGKSSSVLDALRDL